jgi:hypothetical protein
VDSAIQSAERWATSVSLFHDAVAKSTCRDQRDRWQQTETINQLPTNRQGELPDLSVFPVTAR